MNDCDNPDEGLGFSQEVVGAIGVALAYVVVADGAAVHDHCDRGIVMHRAQPVEEIRALVNADIVVEQNKSRAGVAAHPAQAGEQREVLSSRLESVRTVEVERRFAGANGFMNQVAVVAVVVDVEKRYGEAFVFRRHEYSGGEPQTVFT